ncbi:hypothetical protein TGPRC2_357490 [Toxoplasma gondii TgCatPRC2]|nr:hypothetical protein TGARI_357490 [Toxoplasma gondii ARI]KYK71135.1 hypothetical protein TGPRC2_357490 [Toxoplasma gondii TgCatPRC2]
MVPFHLKLPPFKCSISDKHSRFEIRKRIGLSATYGYTGGRNRPRLQCVGVFMWRSWWSLAYLHPDFANVSPKDTKVRSLAPVEGSFSFHAPTDAKAPTWLHHRLSAHSRVRVQRASDGRIN